MALDGDALSEPSDRETEWASIRPRYLLDMHIDDSKNLVSAFAGFFEGLVENRVESLISSVLNLRKHRATFERTRAQCKPMLDELIKKETLDDECTCALKQLTTLYPAITEAEKTYSHWLSGIDIESIGSNLHYAVIKNIPALFDPMCDVLIVDGGNEDVLELSAYGFNRVVSLEFVKGLNEKFCLNSDNDKLDEWVRDLKDLDYLPPRIVTGINTVQVPSEENKCSMLSACQAIRLALTRVLTTRNTLQRFGEEWVKNAIENKNKLSLCEDFKKLQSEFSGKTVVIVGPAPSLKGDIDSLRQISQSAHVICLSQAYRALVEADISADFVIVTDSAYMPDDFAVSLQEKQIYVFDVVTDPRHFDLIGPCRLWPYVASELKAITLRDLFGLGSLPVLHSGGSVSHTAFSLALFLGFDDIVLMGHDFCLTDGKNYMELRDGSSSHAHGGIQRDLVVVKTNDGHEAYSPLDYDIFRKHFERLISHSTYTKGVRVRTTSLAGAEIKGIDPISSVALAEELMRKNTRKESVPDGTPFPNDYERRNDSETLPLADPRQADLHEAWRDSAWSCFKTGNLAKLTQLATELSRQNLAVSLYLQSTLTDIDECMRLIMTPSRQRFLTGELIGAICRGLNVAR